MEKMIENLLNKGYTYDTFREGIFFDYYDGFEADVDFWYGEYCEDVDAGVIDPDRSVVEFIADKIEDEHPTSSPEEFESLMRWVRSVLPKIEDSYALTVKREAQIGGTMQFANGEASGRALAGANADKGIRDVTLGQEGRGQAEVDKTGIYVGIPAGPDKTAWANPTAAKQVMSDTAGRRVDAYQAAYAAAPAAEKAAMQDWSPEKPDMAMNRDGKVVDTNTGKVMPTTKAAAPQAKSSILGGLKKAFLGENSEMEKYQLFETILGEKDGNATFSWEESKKQMFDNILRESEMSPEEDYIENLKAAAKELGATYEGGWFGKGICGYTNGIGWALNMNSTPAYGLQTYLLARKGSRVSVMNASASSGKDRVSNPKNSVESIVELINERLAELTEEKNSKVAVLKKLEKKIDNYGLANDIWLDGEKLKVIVDEDKENDVYDVFADFRDEVTPEFIVDYHIARGDEEDGTTEVLYIFEVED